MSPVTILGAAAVVLLGGLSGALLTEGMVLVPHWRTLRPDEFAGLHHGFAPRLYRFFAPLTIVSVAVAVAAGITKGLVADSAGRWPTIASAAAAASLLAFYGGYFKGANARLPLLAAGGDTRRLAAELRRWQRLHQLRTGVCIGAFVLATAGIAG